MNHRRPPRPRNRDGALPSKSRPQLPLPNLTLSSSSTYNCPRTGRCCSRLIHRRSDGTSHRAPGDPPRCLAKLYHNARGIPPGAVVRKVPRHYVGARGHLRDQEAEEPKVVVPLHTHSPTPK